MKIGKITNCADFQTANAYSDTFTSGNNGNGSNVGIKSKRGIIGSSNNVSTNGGAACPSGNYSNAVSGSGSGGNSEHESETTRTLDVVDQLHDLFRNMSIFDETVGWVQLSLMLHFTPFSSHSMIFIYFCYFV